MATQLGGKRLEILTELVPAPTPYSRTRRSNLDGAASPRCSPKRRRMARGRAAIYPVHRPRRSRQLSTERRSPTPRHSTCWRRPFSTALLYRNRESYWTGAPCCDLPRSTNGLRRRRKTVSPPTVRGSPSWTASSLAKSSRYCGAPSQQIFRSSSRPTWSWWSILAPLRNSV